MRIGNGRSSAVSAARAFSLVEVLVVIGIMTVLTGILIPVTMRARHAARATQCRNNLRQIGAFYQIYGDANHDSIPLGTTVWPPDWPGYHTAMNNIIWLGAPASACGPLLISRMINEKTTSLFYCPLEVKPEYQYETYRDRIRRVAGNQTMGAGLIRIGYAVRPVRALWLDPHDPDGDGWPTPMPRLSKMRSLAIVAENPQVPPFNHGSESDPGMHVMYADGSVKLVFFKAYRDAYQRYVEKAAPEPPGKPEASNLEAINEQEKGAQTIWRALDEF